MHSGFSILFIIIFEPSAHIICYEYSFFGEERQANILDCRNPTPNISLCVKDMEQHQGEEVVERPVWKDGLGWEKAKWGRFSEKDYFWGSEFHCSWGVIQTVPRKASSGPHLVQVVSMVRLLLQRSKSQKLVLANVGNGSVTDCQLRSFFPSENTLKFTDTTK